MPYNSRQRRALLILLACAVLVIVVLYSSSARKRIQKAKIFRWRHKRNATVYAKHVSKWFHSRIAGKQMAPCDPECREFQTLMAEWPHERPKAAIYYLAAGRGAIRPLSRSIHAFQHNFNDRYRYPIIVFIDNSLNSTENRRSIQSMGFAGNQRTIFVQVADFRWSPVLAGAPNISALSSADSRHDLALMLTDWFHVVGVYHQPVTHTRGLRYLMHMTGRQVVVTPIKFDPFQYMHDHQLLYGFHKLKRSSSLLDVGLWNTVQRYVTAKQLDAPLFQQWYSFKKGKRHFTTEFELYSLEIWMSWAFRDYVNYIERYGGFSRRKWKAESIRTIAVTLLVKQRNQLHQFTDISVQRADTINRKRTTSVNKPPTYQSMPNSVYR